MPRFVLGYLDWAERLRTGEQANFQEKAHSVKADVAAPFVAERSDSVSFALCFHPHFR
jgi:hypothetical protein